MYYTTCTLSNWSNGVQRPRKLTRNILTGILEITVDVLHLGFHVYLESIAAVAVAVILLAIFVVKFMPINDFVFFIFPMEIVNKYEMIWIFVRYGLFFWYGLDISRYKLSFAWYQKWFEDSLQRDTIETEMLSCWSAEFRWVPSSENYA